MAYENYTFVKIKDGKTAPKGFHYMPNGRLMSDGDHIAVHGYIEKKITGFNINTKDINYQGETRSFSLSGQVGAFFSIEIYDDAAATNYYNFDTKLFSTTKPSLKVIKLTSNNYKFGVTFAKVDSSLIKYTVNILTHIVGNIKTVHMPLVEAKYPNDTINQNESKGSNSNLLTKILYQDVAKNLYLSCVAPSLYLTSADTVDGTVSSSNRIVIDGDATDMNVLQIGDKVTGTGIASSVHALITSINPDNDDVNEFQISVTDSISDGAAVTFTPPFNGMTPHYTDSTTGRNTTVLSSGGVAKTSFSITCTALTGRTFSIARVPTINDLCAITEVTFESAASAISGEDISSDTYYRWPVENIANLSAGMSLDPARSGTGANTTTPAVISNYLTTETLKSVTETEYSTTINDTIVDDVSVDGVDSNYNAIAAIDRNGRITSQAGNITFDKQQADALKSDANVRIFARGADQIKSATGMDVSISNVAVTLTQISTTATSNTKRVELALAEVGNISSASTVRGVAINPLVANPTVTSKNAVSGAGTVLVSSEQESVSGQTYFFDDASNIATITGDISISNMAITDIALYFDVEKFLTAL